MPFAITRLTQDGALGTARQSNALSEKRNIQGETRCTMKITYCGCSEGIRIIGGVTCWRNASNSKCAPTIWQPRLLAVTVVRLFTSIRNLAHPQLPCIVV